MGWKEFFKNNKKKLLLALVIFLIVPFPHIMEICASAQPAESCFFDTFWMNGFILLINIFDFALDTLGFTTSNFPYFLIYFATSIPISLLISHLLIKIYYKLKK
jgi:hypothetical protein